MRFYVPQPVRQAVRRWRHARAIRCGKFGDVSDPLFQRMGEWVSDGDWVIDVGAAVGDYTIALSKLVGPAGRVVALEPMLEQFELLVRNATLAPHSNITCLQVAAGLTTDVCHMIAPSGTHGPNWYEAAISSNGGRGVLRVAVDQLPIPHRVSFMKLDAEGHDLAVLQGAENLLLRDHPALLVESHEPRLVEWLCDCGYNRVITEPSSPNRVYRAA